MNDYSIPLPEKRCSKCGNIYPATKEYFYGGSHRSRFGLQSTCKHCDAKRASEYKKANRAKINARKRDWYWETHDERIERRKPKKEQEKASALQWRNTHLEHARKTNRAYFLEHPDYHAKWRSKHPDKSRLRTSRYHARKKNLPDNFTEDDWERCLAYFDYTCAVCGRPKGLWHILALDHWIPLNNPDCPGTISTNIVPLCQGINGCNNSKADKQAEHWLIEKVGKRKATVILQKVEAYFNSLKDNQYEH